MENQTFNKSFIYFSYRFQFQATESRPAFYVRQSIPLGQIPRSLLRFNPEQNIKYPTRLRRGLYLKALVKALPENL